jgi:hypothetical protein
MICGEWGGKDLAWIRGSGEEMGIKGLEGEEGSRL